MDVTLLVSDDNLVGTIHIPTLNIFVLELSGVSLESNRLRLELDSSMGMALWEGEIRDGEIEGEYSQKGIKGTFFLQRFEDTAADADNGDGWENYRREEVALANGEIVLAGDLTLPEGEGPFPAVVLINGRGNLIGGVSQGRDSNFRGFKIFKVLTGHLVRSGIAVLRFDGRGVGGSTGDGFETTIQDRAGDVLTGVNFLKSRDDISGERIGLIGHGEGGNVAPIVAHETDDVAYVALLAAPAIPGVELERQKLRRFQTVNGGSAEKIERELAELDLFLKAAVTGQGWEEVEAMIRRRYMELITDEFSSEILESIEDVDLWLESVVAAELAHFRRPWFKSFAKYDPRPALVALDVPVLALFAEHDVHWLVPADIHSVPFSEAMAQSGAPSHTIVTIDSGHAFRDIFELLRWEYSVGRPEFTEQPDFTPEFLEILLGWLAEQTGSP